MKELETVNAPKPPVIKLHTSSKNAKASRYKEQE